jgi:hypothetical protein
MKIFRYYRAEHALAVLNDLEIRTSIPNTLNDPFELSPNIDPSQFSQKRLEAFLRNDYNISDAYEREARERGFASKKIFKRWYLKDVPRRASQLLPKVPKNVEKVRQNFADTFSKHWRLICASLIADSILMWSHYAANHTGIVVELDTSELPFSQIDDALGVSYSETKPTYVHFNNPQEFLKAMFSVASTKAPDWKYEKEVRIVIAVCDYLRDALYLAVTPACVTGIYLGCRASVEVKRQVCSALKREHFGHVRLMQAELDPAEYALRFKELR